MEIELFHAKSGKSLGKISDLDQTSTIHDVKSRYHIIKPHLYPDRQAFRTEPRGKTLKDSETLQSLSVLDGGKLYFKDLGPQVGWTTVFLTEYAGPLLIHSIPSYTAQHQRFDDFGKAVARSLCACKKVFLTEYAGPLVIYLLFYIRPALIYGRAASQITPTSAANIACYCWTFHYAKRLFETVYVHRFSHATMPILNIFKNSAYYWGFTAFVAYFMNHPLYTPPSFGNVQLYTGLTGFVLCELGNFSVHMALRNLRPAGSTVRRIPYAGTNPFTWLFHFVSCPNYTYESGAWLSFSIMTQCLPALIFGIAGFVQMSIWAMGKHRNYKREFKDYPKGRKCIVPFFL